MSMKKKTAYETPAIVPLGELARGSGICSPVGSVPRNNPNECTTGEGARFNNICTTGRQATAQCKHGPNGPTPP